VKITYLVLLNILIFPVVKAEVITDGSLGAKVELPGKDFQITPELGQQFGGNLFHSFQQFNLSEGESATFSGANSVQNIITRVTGGSPSMIDGTLRSTIPNADLYFLNPYGVMFGKNAKLDLQGGFHVSTADYLKLQDGGRFEARTPSNSLLTVAPVTAFGFLTNTPAAITLQGSSLIPAQNHQLSLYGGDITLRKVTLGNIIAIGMKLSSIASSGVIIPSAQRIDLEGVTRLGNIILDSSRLAALNGGGIYIQAGQLLLNQSLVSTTSDETTDGGDISIDANNIIVGNKSTILTGSFSSANSGSIRINVSDLFIMDDSKILSSSDSRGLDESISVNNIVPNIGGNAGHIFIQSKWLYLQSGSYIKSSNIFGSGKAGSILLKADEIRLSGVNANGSGSYLSAGSEDDQTENAGAAGNIIVEARQILLTDGARITNSTAGSGQGGTIALKVSDTLTLNGKDTDGAVSGILAKSNNSDKANAGNAGSINIEARQIILADGTVIRSDTAGTGQGGIIQLHIGESLTITGIDAEGLGGRIAANSNNDKTGVKTGKAGDVTIEAGEIHLQDGAQINTLTRGSGQGGAIAIKANLLTIDDENTQATGIYASSKSPEANGGDAGQIEIETRQVTLTNGGWIKSNTSGGGNSGSIVLNGLTTLTVTGVDKEGNRSQISTNSEKNATGDAGQIVITADQVLLSNRGQLTSSTAGTGQGGIITLNVANNLNLSDGYIAANSNSEQKGAGHAGNITIHAGQILLNDGAQINTITRGGGLGGTIDLRVQGSLTVSGKNKEDDISGINSSSENSNSYAGHAGAISIQAHAINLQDSGKISTTTSNASGGDIKLNPYLLNLQQGRVTSTVKGGKGDGGNITVADAKFITLNQAKITAQADKGHGGNIQLAAQHFVKSIDSLISASSNLGVDGQITIDSPAEDIGSQVLSLSANYLNAASLFPRSCAARIADQRPSQFVRPFTLIFRPKTAAHAPEDTRASPYPATLYYKWFDQYR